MSASSKNFALWSYKLETQILLEGDLGFIEQSESASVKKEIEEIERMLKALIKSLENKPSNP